MTVSATVVADSISPEGIRLTTLHLRYPRFILAEMNTHRIFSRNARSTRAVPVKKFLEEIRTEPVIPMQWGINKPGMQSSEVAETPLAENMEKEWREAANRACDYAEKLFELGLHKQWSGRILEPFMHVDQLVSSTGWQNFFGLRDDEDAQPEIREVAVQIKGALNDSTPKLLEPDQWHLPYICDDDYAVAKAYIRGTCCGTAMSVSDEEAVSLLQKISTARCARLSIKPYDGNGSIERELERYEKLVVSRPVHSSPAEHIATPDYKSDSEFDGVFEWQNKDKWGNFFGWQQYRHFIPYNTIEDR